MGLYRRGLNYVVESLLQETDAQAVDALWRVFLLYDGLILGPFRKGAQFASLHAPLPSHYFHFPPNRPAGVGFVEDLACL